MGGVIPLSRSLDTLGPLAPDVRTAIRALELMTGWSNMLPYRPRTLGELRVGVARGWDDDLEPAVAGAWSAATAGLPPVELPDRRRMAASGLVILLAEAAAYHRDWLERNPHRYGDDVRRLLEQGLDINQHDYSQALLDQSRIRVETEAAMEGWDAVLTPTSRVLPPLVGEPYDRGDVTGYTRPFNTTGQPVVTLPAPVPADAIPVGICAVAHFGQDAQLAEVALALESAWKS
jgi:aspartyl-tRNA(Asn)/glutamyl-tRNA(Gln) amidotransferase subunit A